VGPEQSPRQPRSHTLEIEASVLGGQLELRWHYSPEWQRAATIERLADDYLAALQGLIAHCLSPDAGGYTPSDFVGSGLSQRELDELMIELDESLEE